MAKKTYKTYSLKGLQLLFFDEFGRPMEVNFKGGVHIDSTAKFTTSDEKVQKAIEGCSGFNRDFYLESVRDDNPAPVHTAVSAGKEEVIEEPVDEEKVVAGGNVVEVADKSEAIEWLKEHFPDKGYTAVKLRTMDAVIKAGKEHGVVFDVAE